MTAPEVQFVLDSISNNYSGVTDIANVPLERIDRDNADNLDQSTHSMTGQLDRTNFVGASLTTRNPTPIGASYDLHVENVVGIRIEGAHHTEHGHIDPDGNNGVQWDTLVRKIRRAILQDREEPSVSNRTNSTYTHIEELNPVDTSSDFADYYRFDADYAFVAYETLP